MALVVAMERHWSIDMVSFEGHSPSSFLLPPSFFLFPLSSFLLPPSPSSSSSRFFLPTFILPLYLLFFLSSDLIRNKQVSDVSSGVWVTMREAAAALSSVSSSALRRTCKVVFDENRYTNQPTKFACENWMLRVSVLSAAGMRYARI